MKSKIYLNEVVPNKDRRFGSATDYYPVKVVTEGGDIEYALFTINQIEEAIERASYNKEDLPEKSIYELIFES